MFGPLGSGPLTHFARYFPDNLRIRFDHTQVALPLKCFFSAGVRRPDLDDLAELLAVADVDSALVGGASLAAEDFWAIGEASP